MSSSRKVLRSQENVSRPGASGNGKSTKRPPAVETGQPKAPRSAFMCFSDANQSEIMARHGISKGTSKRLLDLVATEWRSLSSGDRAHWDEAAREDKVRFVQEKAAYQGPWAVPKRRRKKDPRAPKRPMSAFLKYSQKRRSIVKQDNPDMSNTDVSRLLGEMWRNASTKEREPYVESEQKERAVYKEKIKNFNEEQAKEDAASRTSHKTVQKMAEYPQLPTRPSYEETLPSAFESTLRIGTVEDAANKVDQRMMFRHNFGAPLASYRPSYDAGHHHHHHHAGGHHHYSAGHQRAPEYAYPPPPEPTLPPAHRPAQSHHLEEEDDLLYSGNYTNYFSDGLGFNFYNNGYP